MPDLIIGPIHPEAHRRAVQHVDRTGVIPDPNALAGHPDGQVGRTVIVEVSGGYGRTKQVPWLGSAFHAGLVLMPDLIVGRTRPEAHRRAVQHVHRAGVIPDPDALAGHSDGQVTKAVVVKISRSQGTAKAIPGLGHTFYVGLVLVPDLIVGRIYLKSRRRAVQHVHRAGVVQCPNALAGYPDGQVVKPVIVKVAGYLGVPTRPIELRRGLCSQSTGQHQTY
jgi:hypothetical protein